SRGNRSPGAPAILAGLAGSLPNETEQEIQGYAVLAALGDDDVGEALRRLHERQMHRPDALVILLSDLREGAPPMLEVAADAAHHADVGIRVDEELHLEARAQAVVREHENALDDDDRRRRDPHALLEAVVDGEVVRGAEDRRTGT